MHLLYFILFTLAFVCFSAAAFSVPARFLNWVALGLALCVLVSVIQQGRAL